MVTDINLLFPTFLFCSQVVFVLLITGSKLFFKVLWYLSLCTVWVIIALGVTFVYTLFYFSSGSRAATAKFCVNKITRYEWNFEQIIMLVYIKWLFHVFMIRVRGKREIDRDLRSRGLGYRSGAHQMQKLSLAVQRGNAASVMGTFASGTSRDGKFN